MRKYNVTIKKEFFFSTEVEANSAREAKELALTGDTPKLIQDEKAGKVIFCEVIHE